MNVTPDLADDEALRTIHSAFLDAKMYASWSKELVAHHQWYQGASAVDRASEAFQRRLWDDNPISGVGMGTVRTDAALKSESFRQWLVDALSAPLANAGPGRIEQMQTFRSEFDKRWAAFGPRRPILKCFRVMATAWPTAFTTLADTGRMMRVYEAMFGTRRVSPVSAHIQITERLDKVLGEVDPADLEATVARQCFCWHLYSLLPAEDEGPVVDATPAHAPPVAQPALVPLPPVQRRKGMTSIKGYLPSVMSALEQAREGIAVEDFKAFLHGEHPQLKENSLTVHINVLRAELGVIKRAGDTFVLTERGSALLESNDPLVLAPFVLTRILGPDFVIAHLRDHGPTRSAEIKTLLRTLNPGWTQDFVAGSILGWLRSLDVLRSAPDGTQSLTEAGEAWAKLITWTPAGIAVAAVPVDPPMDGGDAGPPSEVVLPAFATIRDRVRDAGYFTDRLVEDLHAGLWANRRRHFVVLSGLSGAGKTRLADAYARAILRDDTGQYDPTRMCAVTVHPGWADPSPLLGYVNPLEINSYVTTPFLEFLLRAVENPSQPHVLLLDEMNLSHPEQYLAPLLSAMERHGATLALRPSGDVEDDVPAEVPYPDNLAIIGTVNMDETTHGLSDKVLDRAFALEFWDIDLAAYKWDRAGLPAEARALAQTVLTELMGHLAPVRMHFGYRAVDDVLGFLERVSALGAGRSAADALDSVVYQKILPKLRGEDNKAFVEALRNTRTCLKKHGLERSARKVESMEADLRDQQSARFWR